MPHAKVVKVATTDPILLNSETSRPLRPLREALLFGTSFCIAAISAPLAPGVSGGAIAADYIMSYDEDFALLGVEIKSEARARRRILLAKRFKSSTVILSRSDARVRANSSFSG